MEFSSYSSYSFSLKALNTEFVTNPSRGRKRLFYYNIMYLYRTFETNQGSKCLLPLYSWEFQYKKLNYFSRKDSC